MAEDPKFPLSKPDMPRPRRAITEPIARPSSPASSSAPAPAPGSASTASQSDELVETLYSHPSVKIISFTSTQSNSFGSRPSSSHEDRPGTLPASSRLERTLAVGPFRIYRAPGSVAFLSCGSALQPILPKSQCWCIDEDNSRFVLQIRRPQYWRIELPILTPDDQDRALLLKQVLDKTLSFEKTHCPFKRSFTVEIPEDPHTPIKKKAWTPEGKNLISSPFSDSSPQSSPTARLYMDRRSSTLSDISLFRDDLGTHSPRDLSQYNYRPESRQLMSESEESTATEEKENSSLPKKLDLGALKALQEGGQSLASNFGPVLDLANIPWDIVKDNVVSYNTRQSISGQSDISPTSTSQNQRAIRTQEEAATSAVRDAEQLLGPTDFPSILTQPRTSQAVDFEKWESTLEENPATSNKMEKATGKEVDEGPSSFEGSGRIAPLNLKKKRMSRMLAGRTYTAPPQVTTVSSIPSRSRRSSSVTKPRPLPHSRILESDESSPAGSSDSFHSVQSWNLPANPLPPSPPSSRPVTPSQSEFPHPHDPHPRDDIVVPSQSPHQGDNPAYTNTPETDRTFNTSSTEAKDHANEPASPIQRPPTERRDSHVTIAESSKESHASGVEEKPQIRPRPRPHSLSMSRRALSPLPPPANFFSPPSRQTPQSRFDTVRRLPGTIINKTVELILSPPTFLVNIMLKVAARILAGEWRGLFFGIGEGGEKIPVQWDYSDDDLSDWSDDEDSYISARNKQKNSSSNNSSNSISQSEDSRWEVD
ncbi:inheritance of peroxisomes protein 1-domain-containing protein [Daldinia caldariorum]|uniref:inheritance of peroxisomes protein 1-domain-containing protein n=1 Tax=Daldinia caldariorum TaxID=326644 RepID=UPI00200856CE|nr:inheritance of peroxisomes protein 1-domain-containing protein [Daldinia caldariorum]KAI1469217.1 inheritance of peroxisomes protein 1-domain-containing protein [Daldinia caldariorum]